MPRPPALPGPALGHRRVTRFLHTADWLLGLRLNFVPGEAGARLRAERFATVERIAELARVEQADAVIVAGDVFDDNGVGPDTIQQAREADCEQGRADLERIEGPARAARRLFEVLDAEEPWPLYDAAGADRRIRLSAPTSR